MAAGCNTVHKSSHHPADGVRLFTSRDGNAGRDDFRKQVEKDPFPKAGQARIVAADANVVCQEAGRR